MLPVFLWILTSGENYFSVSISFQTPAANAPPANGPRIKICSHWDRYLGMTAAMTQVPVPTATTKSP